MTLTGESFVPNTTEILAGTLINQRARLGLVEVAASARFTNNDLVETLSNQGITNNSGTIENATNAAGASLVSTGIISGNLFNSGVAQLGGSVALDTDRQLSNEGSGRIDAIAPLTIGRFFQDSDNAQFNVGTQEVTMNALSGRGLVSLGTGRLTVAGAPESVSGFSGAISGNGSLIVDGGDGSRLFLLGTNSYTGGTAIRAGGLFGNTASLQGAITVANGALLGFDQRTDGIFAGTLAGGGRITTAGQGRLVINGNNGFSGIIDASGRDLQINGNLAAATVQLQAPGAALSGIGTVGTLRPVTVGAIISPGSAPGAVGTINVTGTLNDLGTSFTYQADVSPVAADRITVGGTANLAGTLAINAAPGNYRLGSYVLLSAAGGRTGEFATVTGLGDFGAGFRPAVTYTGTEVILRIAPNAMADVLGNAPLTFNQRSAVTRFDASVTSGLTDPNGFIAFYNLPVTAIAAAFDTLSGEVHASAVRLVLDDERLVRRATLDQLAATTGTEGGNAWIAALGRVGNIDGDGNAAKITRDSIGIIAGADIGDASDDDAEGWRAGVQGHYLRTSFAIDERASSGTIDRFGGGIYGALRSGGFGVKLGATVASVELSTTRSITVPGFAETADSEGSGSALQGYGEVTYRVMAGSVTLEPFAGISHTRFDIGTINESGQLAAVSIADRDDRLTVVDVGLRGMATVKTGRTGRIDLRTALGVRQVLGSRDLTSDVAFASVPTVGFAVATIAQDRTAFAPEIGSMRSLAEDFRWACHTRASSAKQRRTTAFGARSDWRSRSGIRGACGLACMENEQAPRAGAAYDLFGVGEGGFSLDPSVIATIIWMSPSCAAVIAFIIRSQTPAFRDRTKRL